MNQKLLAFIVLLLALRLLLTLHLKSSDTLLALPDWLRRGAREAYLQAMFTKASLQELRPGGTE